MASGLFRFLAALGRNLIVASTVASLALLAVEILGGFIISRGDLTYLILSFTCELKLALNK
jgi:hypothetical protein